MIRVEVQNIDKIKNDFTALHFQLPKYINAAGQEISAEILNTKGLRKYPPATEANFPPAPYYKRGVGMQLYGRRNVGGKFISGNLKNSEQLGKRWQTKPISWGVKILNDASYAPYVNGNQQSHVMAGIGWRKLEEVANEKIDKIKTIFQKWIDKLILDKGL